MRSDQLQRICHGHNFGHISLDSTVGLTAHPFTDPSGYCQSWSCKKWFAFRRLDDWLDTAAVVCSTTMA